MQSVLLPLEKIPPLRLSRNGADIRRWIAEDEKQLVAMAPFWVRRTAKTQLAALLAAGNPRTYTVGIDGTTGTTGRVRQGFHGGSIEQARSAVRVEFIARQLADIANQLKPILRDVILETFPYSQTRRLSRNWSWWVQKDAHIQGSGVTSQYIGATVPPTVGLYDVLWLMPDKLGSHAAPAGYAWSSNRKAIKQGGTVIRRVRRGKDRGKDKAFNRLTGWLAQSTKRMRGRKIPGVSIQGRFITRGGTSSARETRHGIPVIRLAFKLGLSHDISV